MLLTYRYRLNPEKRQHRAFETILEQQRTLYNSALAERIDTYGKSLGSAVEIEWVTYTKDGKPLMGVWLKREGKRWLVGFQVEAPAAEPRVKGKPIGVDWGTSVLAALSSDDTIPARASSLGVLGVGSGSKAPRSK